MDLSIMSKPQALFKILYLDGFRWFYLKYYITFFTSYIMFFCDHNQSLNGNSTKHVMNTHPCRHQNSKTPVVHHQSPAHSQVSPLGSFQQVGTCP